MKNIHVLSTDKPSRLYLTTHEYIFEKGYSLSTDECENKNIYITSDEEIKEGDWIIDLVRNNIYEASGISNEDNNIVLDSGSFANINQCKKIILTTDQDLIKDGVQVIDDEFLEWFVKNPSCEEIEIDKINLCTQTSLPCGMQCLSKETCNKNISYKIIIPKEEQDKNKYSEEEVQIKLYECLGHFAQKHNIIINGNEIDKWFEQFKNK